MSAIDLILTGALFLCQLPATTDGDTIRCDQGRGQRVRVFGIQAPERTDPGGPASTQAMRQLVTGHTLTCTIRGPDSYSRKVALCRLEDGTDIAAEMVRLGQAVDWPKFSGGRYGRAQ